ncbi:MAG: signal recognition particle protein [Planctomycetes bacterium]|nr:signal recognition particle protein [Planctomycetota bacterium]
MFETLTDRLSTTFSFLRGRKELTEENVAEGLREVRQALLEADVNFKVARDFTERVKARVTGEQRLQGVDPSQQFVHAFHQELVELMGPEDAQLSFAKSGPTVVLMAGLQGAGKTTTCAKLAKFLREKRGKRPLMVAADIKRPAAVEQLKVLGRQLDVPVFHEEGLTPPQLCAKGVEHARKQGYDLVLLDTAGRLHVDDELMAEVAEIAKATQPHDQVLVVDAMTGQDAVNSAKAFDERLQLTGCILTKLDGDARGGAAVSLKAVTGRPILFIGTGEKIDDLDAFHPERMAGRILGMGDVVGLVERAQEQISEHEAQAAMEKLLLGSFTLEDMLAQMRMIRRMGPMKKVLGMMPGMPKEVRDIDVDDKQMNRLEALFTSMTPQERLKPDLLDMSRRRRIARGAGQGLDAVNELLKRYKQMQQMMKQMNKLGLGSMLGAGAKKETLRGMSATGELASGGGGMMDALGGLGAGLGAGVKGLGSRLFGGGGAPAGMEDLASMMGGPRPMGSSATRKSGSKKDKRKKDKKKRKGRR